MEPAARRAQILGEAARLFGAKGYHDTSVSDIIAAAGIARGTFYLYFNNKRGIFEELVDGLLERLRESIRVVDVSPGAPSAREQLVDNIARVIELLAEKRDLLAILLEGAVGLDKGFDEKLSDFYGKVADTLEGSLLLGGRMGIVRNCDTRIAALAALGAFKEILHYVLRRDAGEPLDIKHLASEVIDVFSRGVLTRGATIS